MASGGGGGFGRKAQRDERWKNSAYAIDSGEVLSPNGGDSEHRQGYRVSWRSRGRGGGSRRGAFNRERIRSPRVGDEPNHHQQSQRRGGRGQWRDEDNATSGYGMHVLPPYGEDYHQPVDDGALQRSGGHGQHRDYAYASSVEDYHRGASQRGRGREWRGRGRGRGKGSGDRMLSPGEEYQQPRHVRSQGDRWRGGGGERGRGRGRGRERGSGRGIGSDSAYAISVYDDDTDRHRHGIGRYGGSFHGLDGTLCLDMRIGRGIVSRMEGRGSTNPWHNQSRGPRRGRGRKILHPPEQVHNNFDAATPRYLFNPAHIQNLSALDSEELVKKIDSQLKEFQQAIGNSESMNAVVDILLKLTNLACKRGVVDSDDQRAASRIVAEILSERSEGFHFHLSQAVNISTCICTIQAERFCDLFLALLNTFESSARSCLPIDELRETANRLTGGDANSPLLIKAQELLETRDQMRAAHTSDKNTNKDGPTSPDDERDDSEFRSLPLLPKWEEICKDNGTPPEVRPNRLDTRYKDWMQYYDIQFRLIREDFIAPLRKGVTAFLNGERGKKNRDVKTYSDAVIYSQVTTRDKGICFRIRFDVTGFHKVNYKWDHSKRLIFGSLLCFIPSILTSKDNILFATVADRKYEDLTKGYFMVQFENDITDAMTHCRLRTKFEIVEPNSYFGATSPILQSLQKAEVDTMPFTKQLIEGECDAVVPPAYLRDEGKSPVYNLSCLHGKKRRLKPPLMIEVLNKASWDAAGSIELDTSQLNAIQTALTQEIAVIQGPPGTGKTYIGLKIVEGLLQNRLVWDPSERSPIFVMCYTNHALDQFLEGIIDAECCEEIIRVGGQSKNERVDAFNLNKVCRNAKFYSSRIGYLREELDECNPEKNWWKLNGYHERALEYGRLLPLNIIQHVAHPDHFYPLTQMVFCDAHKNKEMEVWLGLWTEELYNFKRREKKKKNVMPESGEKMERNDQKKKKAQQSDEEPTQKMEGKESQEKKAQLSDEEPTQETEGKESIHIEGEAILAQNERMLGDDREGYERVVSKETEENSSDDDSDKEGDSQGSDDEPEYTWFRRTNAASLIRKHLFKNPMDDEEADEVEDIRSLSQSDRWRLYNYWEEKQYKYMQEHNREQVQQYNEICRELADLKQCEDMEILEGADVVGMTTTGAAKYQHILRHIKPKIVIVEEAAEVLEAHIVSALTAGTQHLILIGDHKQLRPKPNEYVLATKYNLAVSLFERLVRNKLSRATLEIQHRMRPEIARLVCPHVYDKLLNHEGVEKYPEVQGISKNLFLVHHTHPESENPNVLSSENNYEAEYIVGLCSHLLNLGYSASQITILTPYVGQLLNLRGKMPREDRVHVTAIDNFQGEENDIILFSMVRSSNTHKKEATIGFLKEDNRVCVSLSRAKHGFYAIGNFHLIRQQSMLWESIISDVDERGCFGDSLPLYCCNHPETNYTAKRASDFKNNAPKGGCQKECDIRLPCGHSCIEKCHIVDREHKNFKCMKICERTCSSDHPCKSKHTCWKKCPPCQEMVQKVMPECGHKQVMECYENVPCMELVMKVMPICGHEQVVPCSINPRSVLCKAPCSKSCENNHLCSKLCYEDCGHCFVEIEKEIPVCKHKQMVQCYILPIFLKCQAPCPKLCQNGLHSCPNVCSEKCGKCMKYVEKKLSPCGHTQNVKCYKEPNLATCKKECEKLCPNKLHILKKLCYQEWPICQEKIENILPKCGHRTLAPCFSDPSEILCDKPCDKSCKKDHACPKSCHEDCGPCLSKVQKKLVCGHTHTMQCSQTSTFKCPTQCSNLRCKSGHECTQQCHYPLPCGSCDKRVKICMPECSHVEYVPCFTGANPKRYGFSCTHPCEKLLECGHKCQKKCGEYCQKLCTEKVTVKRDCGHDIKIECHRKNQLQGDTIVVNCKEKVNVKVSCGHTVRTDCWKAKYKSVLMKECNGRCDKTLKCGHVCPKKCSEKCTEQCMKLVKRKWPCGHELERECYQTKNMDQYPCDEKCRKKLSCGHPCMSTCGKLCSTCHKKSLRRYPCGHSAKIPCNSSVDAYPCKRKCQFVLSCGHCCSGKCGECSLSRLHAICIFDIKVDRHCGHSETVPCAGLSDFCRKTHQLSCLHGEDYTKCHDVCRWNCLHFQCEKECREECDRPPCNEPCDGFLPCGHQCPGICGEPCLSICPTCHRAEFVKKLHPKQKRLPINQLYIELGCGHIFTVQFLDGYMDPKINTVRPKQCPKCHFNIPAGFRYGNAAKRARNDIEHVRQVIGLHTSIPEIEREALATRIREMTIVSPRRLCTFKNKLDEGNPIISEESCLVQCLSSYSMTIVSPKHLRTFKNKLDNGSPINSEESCLVQCLSSCSNLYCCLQSQDTTYSDIREIMGCLKSLVTTLLSSAKYSVHEHHRVSAVIPERKSAELHLSWQLLKDFKSELYRLALRAQCIVGRHQHPLSESSSNRTGPGSAITAVENYVCSLDPLKDRISEEDYDYYSSQIETAIPSVAIIHVQTPAFPPVIKGTWMKCSAGHYYCTPPVCGSGAKSLGHCPECL